MSGRYSAKFARRLFFVALPLALVGASAAAGPNRPEPPIDPLRFFEGRTESLSTIRVFMKKPYRSRTIGHGEIGKDGVLKLVQRVHQDGKAPYDRTWRMREVAPGRFTGTMSEAKGPVTVEQVGPRYRFRFRMKGNVSIEQWLTPISGGTAARSKLSIRKLGMTVGRSEGIIRKL